MSRGANPNQIAYQGITPLSLAESAQMVNLLLSYGADPNIPDEDGDLPIIARIDNRDTESIKALVRGGMNLDHVDRLGVSARHHFRRVYGFDITQI